MIRIEGASTCEVLQSRRSNETCSKLARYADSLHLCDFLAFLGHSPFMFLKDLGHRAFTSSFFRQLSSTFFNTCHGYTSTTILNDINYGSTAVAWTTI